MNADAFTAAAGYYIDEINAPNNIWPSTATVSFDGLVSGNITPAQYDAILAKLHGNLNDPSDGIILEYIVPPRQPPSNFTGVIKKDKFLNLTKLVLNATWDPSPSSDIVAYRIYNNQTLIEQITADSPLVFTDCLHSTKQARHYQLVAVDSAGDESIPVRISITNG
jgi:hypothetical protein